MGRDYSKKTIEEAELATESYVKENYQNIDSVEVTDVFRSPMGGMIVEGTVNNQAEFNISMDESIMKVQGAGLGEGFPDRKEDYDLETREQAAVVAESYLRNNYEDVEIVEFRKFYSLSDTESMEILGDLNTYKIVIVMHESTFEVEEIEIYNSTEGLNAPYEKPERKAECVEVDCDY